MLTLCQLLLLEPFRKSLSLPISWSQTMFLELEFVRTRHLQRIYWSWSCIPWGAVWYIGAGIESSRGWCLIWTINSSSYNSGSRPWLFFRRVHSFDPPPGFLSCDSLLPCLCIFSHGFFGTLWLCSLGNLLQHHPNMEESLNLQLTIFIFLLNASIWVSFFR